MYLPWRRTIRIDIPSGIQNSSMFSYTLHTWSSVADCPPANGADALQQIALFLVGTSRSLCNLPRRSPNIPYARSIRKLQILNNILK